MEYLTLPTGASMPMLGLGTYLSKSDKELETALRAAIHAGYRLIDTAYVYENEAALGRVLSKLIEEGVVKREDLFIVTKLLSCAHSDVASCVQQQLEWLHIDYVDLYLIHSPFPMKPSQDDVLSPLLTEGKLTPDYYPLHETWKQMEALYRQGKLRAIGVSNFNERQLTELFDKAEVKPMNLQVECHLNFRQSSLLSICRERNITVTAYSPLGNPGVNASKMSSLLVHNEKVKELGKKYGKTETQILLRFLLDRGVAAVPKSTNPERLKQNISIFDFRLTREELADLEAVEEQKRLILLQFAQHHPWFPFDDIDRSGVDVCKEE